MITALALRPSFALNRHHHAHQRLLIRVHSSWSMLHTTSVSIIPTSKYHSTVNLFNSAGDLNWTDDSGAVTLYNLGDIAWVLTSTALVWIMIPGLGFFYSGLLRRKNALSMIYLSMMTLAVVSFQVRASPFLLLLALTILTVVLLGLLTGIQRDR